MKLNRLSNGDLNWIELVGVEILSPQDTKIICTSYSDNKLYIGEWISEIEGYTNVITTLDEDRALKQLELLGYNIVITRDLLVFSEETKVKVTGLIQAGFTYMIKSEDNFKVENLFIQNVLKQEELEQLLLRNIERIELIQILS